MLENPTTTDSSSSSAPTFKRYAPPNQRNRLGRRNSGGADRPERSNIYLNDSERNQYAASKNVPIVDHGNASGDNCVNENLHSRLIPLDGCCKSEAFQLLDDRWTAAMNAYNNPSIDLAERPVLYTGSGVSAWGNFRLPHQLMPPTVSVPSSASQMDFLNELRHAMRNANASSDT